MLINFLYCIDFPAKADHLNPTDHIKGWLLCSQPIINIKISDSGKQDSSVEYGLSRPDVAQSFKDFPGNVQCGFTISAGKEPLVMKGNIVLEAEVETNNGKSKQIKIFLDLTSSTIQDFDYDDDEKHSGRKWIETEKEYLKTLKKHPWITIRMDITNKCNLRCIMCHYKEKEIYSRPAQNITAEGLKLQLQDIAPYVKHIMLSCGYEPLMSKHFSEIVSMINLHYPHMEIGMCTNGMLLNSAARKTIIEKKVTHVLLSLDGVSKNVVEKIRVGADYEKIVSNIMALRDLKLKFNSSFPLLIMDFVLMNSNIHEAPAFVKFCKELGIEVIDFRHLVGNIYSGEHEEMLTDQKEKYNYYRQLIVEESRKHDMKVRLPEPFVADKNYTPETVYEDDLADFRAVKPDIQTENVIYTGAFSFADEVESYYGFLSDSYCMRPFNEIMIHEQNKIMPCSYYGNFMGILSEKNTLHSIFFNEKFRKVRRKKILSQFDFKCINCPIKANLLPTEIAK